MREIVKSCVATLALCVAALPVTAPTASAADMVMMDYQDGTCSEPRLVNSVIHRFSKQAREVHHQPELAIDAIHDIHEHRYVGGADKLGGIDRRYCGGTAHMSDGQSRTIWFLIEYGMGFAGMGKYAFGQLDDSVEFCISGLDRWNVYNSACRVLR